MTTIQTTHHSSCTATPPENPLFWQAFSALMTNDPIEADALIEEWGLSTDSTTDFEGNHHRKNCTAAIQLIHSQLQRSLEPKPDHGLKLSQREIYSLLRLYALETEILSHCGRCTPALSAWLTNRTHRAINFFNHHASL